MVVARPANFLGLFTTLEILDFPVENRKPDNMVYDSTANELRAYGVAGEGYPSIVVSVGGGGSTLDQAYHNGAIINLDVGEIAINPITAVGPPGLNSTSIHIQATIANGNPAAYAMRPIFVEMEGVGTTGPLTRLMEMRWLDGIPGHASMDIEGLYIDLLMNGLPNGYARGISVDVNYVDTTGTTNSGIQVQLLAAPNHANSQGAGIHIIDSTDRSNPLNYDYGILVQMTGLYNPPANVAAGRFEGNSLIVSMCTQNAALSFAENGITPEFKAGVVDPSAGGGVPANLCSLYFRDNVTVGELWYKTGVGATAWTQII